MAAAVPPYIPRALQAFHPDDQAAQRVALNLSSYFVRSTTIEGTIKKVIAQRDRIVICRYFGINEESLDAFEEALTGRNVSLFEDSEIFNARFRLLVLDIYLQAQDIRTSRNLFNQMKTYLNKIVELGLTDSVDSYLIELPIHFLKRMTYKYRLRAINWAFRPAEEIQQLFNYEERLKLFIDRRNEEELRKRYPNAYKECLRKLLSAEEQEDLCLKMIDVGQTTTVWQLRILSLCKVSFIKRKHLLTTLKTLTIAFVNAMFSAEEKIEIIKSPDLAALLMAKLSLSLESSSLGPLFLEDEQETLSVEVKGSLDECLQYNDDVLKAHTSSDIINDATETSLRLNLQVFEMLYEAMTEQSQEIFMKSYIDLLLQLRTMKEKFTQLLQRKYPIEDGEIASPRRQKVVDVMRMIRPGIVQQYAKEKLDQCLRYKDIINGYERSGMIIPPDHETILAFKEFEMQLDVLPKDDCQVFTKANADEIMEFARLKQQLDVIIANSKKARKAADDRNRAASGGAAAAAGGES